MTFTELINLFVATTGVSTALSVFVMWLLRSWISERLKGAISHEYGQKLETIKAQLLHDNDVAIEQLKTANAQFLAAHASASDTFGSIHSIGQERRLQGIETIWSALLKVRQETPSALLVVDVFPEQDYQRLFFDTPDLQPMLKALNMSSAMTKPLASWYDPEIERSRPFVGEYIYTLFDAYRTVTGRVLLIVAIGISKREITPWYRDDVVRKLIKQLLSADEQSIFDGDIGKFVYLRTTIERKILDKAARIISGEASTAHMLEQTAQIRDSVDQMRKAVERRGEGGQQG